MRKLSFSVDKGEGTRVELDPETEGLRRNYALKVCREETHPFPTLARSFPIEARYYLYDTFVDRRRVHAVRAIVCTREDIEEENTQTPKTDAFDEYLRNLNSLRLLQGPEPCQ